MLWAISWHRLSRKPVLGRNVCASANIDPGARSRESLEHSFWVNKAAKHFEREGYEVLREHPVKGNGAVDILPSVQRSVR